MTLDRPIFTLVAIAGIGINLRAGEPAPEGSHPPLTFEEPPSSTPWVTPNFDIRSRYEFRNVDPFDDSHAWTTRVRAGLLTREFAGFSAFAELEATKAFIEDYRSNPADDSTDPFVANNTVISDPENFELNQAWLQYRYQDWRVRVGRQRIIRNNAAFVGHVGWRQNEQTYDAVDLDYSSGPFFASYSYSNRALRIFGDDANDAPPGAPLLAYDGDFHFFDMRYEDPDYTVGAYSYLIDVENSDPVGRSNSFGVFGTSGPVRAEIAYQVGDSSLVSSGDYGAWYTHLTLSKTVEESTYSVGVEYLQDRFKTPFALLHAFNGFADVFVMQRSGLNNAGGAYEGLIDIYAGYEKSGLPFGLVFKTYLHGFFDDQFGDAYGYEADAVLVKKFNENFTGILKGAYFMAEDGNGFPDVTQITVELNYTF